MAEITLEEAGTCNLVSMSLIPTSCLLSEESAD